MKKQKAYLKECTWKDVREDVLKVNPELAKAIDSVDPSDKHVIYKCRYPFGNNIVKDGSVCLPTATGDISEITNDTIPEHIRENLSYTPDMPAGVLLKNTCEICWKLGLPTAALRFLRPGKMFGLWATLQPLGTSSLTGKMWQITAGARSLFMLPKISDAVCYKKIQKEFNLNSHAPRNLTEHWYTFRELTNSDTFPESWNTDLIFFSKKWLQSLQDPAWKELKLFFLETVWHDSSFARDREVLEAAFSIAQVNKNLKPNPYLSDTVKHLYYTAAGAYTGFKVANDNTAGPVLSLQKIFVDIYGLKFRPTMVYPDFITNDNPLDPIYYSLENPTLIMFSPRSKKTSNKMNDIREIQHIMQAIKSYIIEDKLGLRNTPLYKIVNDIDYDYFHSDHDLLGDTRSTQDLEQLDINIKKETKKYPNLDFCNTSPFLRGCIKLSVK